MRIMPIPPTPGGVDMAAIVSSKLDGLVQSQKLGGNGVNSGRGTFTAPSVPSLFYRHDNDLSEFAFAPAFCGQRFIILQGQMDYAAVMSVHVSDS